MTADKEAITALGKAIVQSYDYHGVAGTIATLKREGFTIIKTYDLKRLCRELLRKRNPEALDGRETDPRRARDPS